MLITGRHRASEMRARSGKRARWLMAGGVLIAVIAAVIALSLIAAGHRHHHHEADTSGPAPAVRDVSGRTRVCLVSSGSSTAQIEQTEQRVWDGLRGTPLLTRASLERFTVPTGSASARRHDRAVEEIADTALTQQCRLIVEINPDDMTTLIAVARRNPAAQFVIGGSSHSPPDNAVLIHPGSASAEATVIVQRVDALVPR